MRKIAFLFALLFAMPASAKDASRCGTDAFGNNVCLDKDGVLSNAPGKSAAGRSGSETKGTPDEAVAERAAKSADEQKPNKVRCGTDQFGNAVCSQ